MADYSLAVPRNMPSVSDAFGKAIALRNAQQQGQLNEQAIEHGGIENQTAKIQLQDQQAMTQAMHDWDGKSYDSLIPLVVKHGGSANAVMGLKAKALEFQSKYSQIAKDDAETGKNNLEAQMKKNDMVSGALKNLSNVDDAQLPGAIAQTAQQLRQQGLIDDSHLQEATQLSQSGATGADIRKALDIFRKGYMADSQQMQEAKDQADIANKNAQTDKIASETNPDNPTDPNFRKAKYEGILGQIQSKGINSVTPQQLQFAKEYELGQQKTTTQSDTLGVTSTSTSKPSGLSSVMRGGVAPSPLGGPRTSGGTTPAPLGGPRTQSGITPSPLSGGAQSLKDSLVDEIGQYKLNPANLSRMMVKHPDIIAQVAQKYPDWQQSNYNAINKAVTDLAPSGKTGQQITSYNTFLRHAGALYDAVDSLDNSKYSDLLNKPLNWLAQHTGDARVADFMAAMQPPMKEFQSFLLNNHAMHDEDVKDAHNLIDQNKTPQEIRAVLKRFAETGSARLSEQNESFKRVTGRDIPNLVSPEAAKAYNKITSQGVIYARDPQGQLHKAPAGTALPAGWKLENQ